MTESETTVSGTIHNTVTHGATAGIQAESVHESTVYQNSTVYHESTVYQVRPGASPEEKYAAGVRALNSGVPSQARELIYEAIISRHDNAEVRFHWVLSMLSKRSYRDLTAEEREQLGRTPAILHTYADDEWKQALEVVCELLRCLFHSEGEFGRALNELLALNSQQRDMIVHHLDLVLTGGMKDHLWAETRRAAENARFSERRLDRVWAYFHPEPAPPRVRKPAPDAITITDWAHAVTWSALFLVAVGYLGWMMLMEARVLLIVDYLLVLIAGPIAAVHGFEWCYRTERIRTKDREYFGPRWDHSAPKGGFADDVDNSFMRYFNTYVPDGVDRRIWHAETAGIRRARRDEVVELYREQRVGVERVNWLIRYLVGDVKKHWKEGELLGYRVRYRTELSTKVWCVTSLVVLVISAMKVAVFAIQRSPLPASIATLGVLVGGQLAAVRWLRVVSERRRLVEDYQEYDERLAERQEAYQRWKEKLDRNRPSENEMEIWLNCDKTMILDDALCHYRLAWRDVIAHAFLLTPARRRNRARVPGGPWRYSKYEIRLFLVTLDGVREISTELDFVRCSVDGEDRNNFRFDAVSSVHVSRTGICNHALELTLMNGPTRSIRVLDSDTRHSDTGENPDTYSKINLESSGFTHTLHILEGIAAEGKGWIDRDPHISTNSVDLRLVVDGSDPGINGHQKFTLPPLLNDEQS